MCEDQEGDEESENARFFLSVRLPSTVQSRMRIDSFRRHVAYGQKPEGK